jgi:hypothetical protein
MAITRKQTSTRTTRATHATRTTRTRKPAAASTIGKELDYDPKVADFSIRMFYLMGTSVETISRMCGLSETDVRALLRGSGSESHESVSDQRGRSDQLVLSGAPDEEQVGTFEIVEDDTDRVDEADEADGADEADDGLWTVVEDE